MAEERWLFLSPQSLIFGINPKRNVSIRLDYDRTELGLAPGVHLAMELTPAEARQLASVLFRKADEAEASQPQH
jgi:hypothetical protein